MTANEEKLERVSIIREKLAFIADVIPFLLTIFQVATFAICITIVVQLVHVAEYQSGAHLRGNKILENQDEVIRLDRIELANQREQLIMLNKLLDKSLNERISSDSVKLSKRGKN